MPNQHDAVTSLPEFWRTLAIVAAGFAVALVLSWTIEVSFPHQTIGAAATVEGEDVSG